MRWSDKQHHKQKQPSSLETSKPTIFGFMWPRNTRVWQGILRKKGPQVELGEILKEGKGIWFCSTPNLCICGLVT